MSAFLTTDIADTNIVWLAKQRQQAKTVFEQHGLPTKKVEDWKYTSLWSLSQQSFQPQVDRAALSTQQVEQTSLLADSYRLVIVDGVFYAGLSDLNAKQSGVTLAPLSQVIASTEHVFGQQLDINKAGLNALNTMLAEEGLFLELDAGIELDKPIELLVISTGRTPHLATHLRHLIKLNAGARACLVEHYVSLAESQGFTNVVSEVNLGKNADLEHFKIQHQDLSHSHIATLAAKQADNSNWTTHNISLGAKLARNDIHSQLLGEQAHVNMNGLYIVHGKQHVDNHTLIEHIVPNTTSDEMYKGVLDGNSHAVFNGKVIVHKDAQKTDSNQTNRNILLSRQCEIDSKPEMEIYADDVKCGHGSTVGQLDEQQLFFLRARGLTEVEARNLLTYAFAADVLQRISSISLRETLTALIEQRLPKGLTSTQGGGE